MPWSATVTERQVGSSCALADRPSADAFVFAPLTQKERRIVTQPCGGDCALIALRPSHQTSELVGIWINPLGVNVVVILINGHVETALKAA